MPEDIKNIRFVLKYKKHDCAVWISHLDSVRLFSRAFHRAGLDVVYSEGFNPRPRFVFAVPLPLGAASDCELLEFRLTEALSPQFIEARLSAVLPNGITVVSVLPDPPDFSEIRYAEYAYHLADGTCLPEILIRFLNRDRIEVMKHSKKGEVLKDIEPAMASLTPTPDDGGFTVSLSVAPDNFVGPEPFTNALTSFYLSEGKAEPEVLSIVRRRFLLGDGNTEY